MTDKIKTALDEALVIPDGCDIHDLLPYMQKHHKTIRACIKACQEMLWQPIDTAPRDGRFALAYRPLAESSQDQVVALKRFIGGNNHCWDCTVPKGEDPRNPTDGSCHVTHWRPLQPDALDDLIEEIKQNE